MTLVTHIRLKTITDSNLQYLREGYNASPPRIVRLVIRPRSAAASQRLQGALFAQDITWGSGAKYILNSNAPVLLLSYRPFPHKAGALVITYATSSVLEGGDRSEYIETRITDVGGSSLLTVNVRHKDAL